MLITEESVDIILLCWREAYSQRDIASEFNQRHPEQVSQTTVSRLLDKSKMTGRVIDASRFGRPNTSAEVEDNVLAIVVASPKKSTRPISLELVRQILKKHKFHSYKLEVMHHMIEDDPDGGGEMCNWFLEYLEEDAEFLSKVMFSDEAIFNVNGEVNKQNVRWFVDNKEHEAGRIMV